jgi:SAM-dependent methyltransferase
MTTAGRFADRDALRHEAYADDAKLSARQAIYRFIEHPWPSSGGRVLGAIDLRGDEIVVDVGCGNGNDMRDLQREGFGGTILGFDLSMGMLATVRPLGVPLTNADAGGLPLRTGAADVALAMHMLYHCPDIEATAAELRRVIRRGGALVASTNSVDHLRELRALWTDALSDAAGQPLAPWTTAVGRFALEDGADVLATAFDDVAVLRTDNRLLVPEVGPVVAYIESTRDLSGADVDDESWSAGMRLLAARVASIISAEGALALTVVKGIFVCR